MDWLKEKVIKKYLENKTTVKNISVYDLKQEPLKDK